MKFDPSRMLAKSKEIESVEIEGMGEVEYGHLTMKDYIEIFGEGFTVEKTKPTIEHVVRMCWKMLNKAYPDLAYEDFVGWMPEDINKILETLSEASDFRVGR